MSDNLSNLTDEQKNLLRKMLRTRGKNLLTAWNSLVAALAAFTNESFLELLAQAEADEMVMAMLKATQRSYEELSDKLDSLLGISNAEHVNVDMILLKDGKTPRVLHVHWNFEEDTAAPDTEDIPDVFSDFLNSLLDKED